MAVNVVYNPETQRWVRAGSSDDTGKTIKTDTFGKTAFEVRAERVRQARKEAETPKIISTVVMDGKETRLISSPAFAEKLNIAVEEENKRLEKQFQSQQKATIPDYLRARPQEFKTISKDLLPPKQPISETKEVINTSMILNPPKYVTDTFISESQYTPKFFDYSQEEIKAQKKRTDKYEFEANNPIITGVKEGVKNVAISTAVAVPLVVTAVAFPVTAPILTVGGIGLTAKYGYDIISEFQRGEFGVKSQARTLTELPSFFFVGKELNKFSRGLETRKTNVRSMRNLQSITNENIDWYSQQKRQKDGFEFERQKGLKQEIITQTKNAIKIQSEIQTQLVPKQVIEKPRIKDISQATKDTPIQTYIRESKGQELVFKKKETIFLEKKYKLSDGRTLFQIEPQQKLSLVYRTQKGDFVFIKRINQNIIESKPTLNQIKELKNILSKQNQRGQKDIRQYQLNQFKNVRQDNKYFETSTDVRDTSFFKGGLLRSRKAQLSLKPLSIMKSEQRLFKGKLDYKTRLQTRSSNLNDLSIKTKLEYKNIILSLNRTSPRIIQLQRPRQAQIPRQKQKLKQTPITILKPEIRLSQQPRQAQIPRQAPRQVQEEEFKRTPIQIKTIQPKPTSKIKLGSSIPKIEPVPKLPGRIPIRRATQQENGAYEVYVREQNRWRKIANKEPINKAYNIGASYTDTQPTTKFKLVSKGTTTKQDETKTFINYKFTSNNNIYSEKKKYQKDTIGERKTNGFF